MSNCLFTYNNYTENTHRRGVRCQLPPQNMTVPCASLSSPTILPINLRSILLPLHPPPSTEGCRALPCFKRQQWLANADIHTAGSGHLHLGHARTGDAHPPQTGDDNVAGAFHPTVSLNLQRDNNSSIPSHHERNRTNIRRTYNTTAVEQQKSPSPSAYLEQMLFHVRTQFSQPLGIERWVDERVLASVAVSLQHLGGPGSVCGVQLDVVRQEKSEEEWPPL